MPNIDRLSIRSRPPGRPLMVQSWGKLLFMHWPVPVEAVRRLVPSGLSIDTYDAVAWVGVIPFTMWGIRVTFLPRLPGASRAHELNVRTYVHLDGVPGVWFFSLDVANLGFVVGARVGYHLPYYWARMDLEERAGRTIAYRSERRHPGAPPARFAADWTVGARLPAAEPDSLECFLTERYCLYAADGDRLYRARIHHPTWPLRTAELGRFSSTMLASHGLTRPDDAPLLHYADRLDVEVWRPVRL